MSDYLRDVLGAGSRILNPSQPLALVAADIPSADGEGANEGFWRVQLRDRLGNWAEMGGIFTFEIELEGIGKVTGHAKLEEVVRPGVGRFRVEDHPVLGTRDIELTEDSFEAADALIPDADYERITGKDVTPDTPAGTPALKDSITGDEALQKIYGQMGLHAKESGRFAVGRSVTDVRAAAKETYKTVYEKLKVEYPELMTEFPDYESYWSYASNTLAAGVFTRWADSVDDILPLSKASNKIYAREILGLKEDGMIEFYRNSVNHKSSQELAGAGYASLDRRMAWDYNSYLIKYEDNGLNENDGRYTVRARPDEVTGLLGISGAEDEYGVVIGLDVVSQPGRVTRVGDLEMQQVAPWSNDIQTFDRTGGGSPFRRVSPASQFEVFATENPMPGSTYVDFYESLGLDKESRPIPTKWDEMFGEGSFDALNGDYPYYQSIKNLFIDAGDGKVGLDMMELDQISSRDSQNPQANDTYDKTLKMLSVIQELSGKTFMVHRGHNQDDPRIPDESVEAPEPVEVSIPAEPGTLPIPEGHVRLFHYTFPDAVDSIRKQGLIPQEESRAAQQGEPAMIWASEQFDKDQVKPVVEFHVPKSVWESGPLAGNAFSSPVPPQNILGIHEQWHNHARYLLKKYDPASIQSGELDKFKGKNPDVDKAIDAVMGREVPEPVEVSAPDVVEEVSVQVDEEDGPSIAEMIKDIEENPEKYPPLLPEKPADTPEEKVGVTHSFGDKEYYFSPEELQNAEWYASAGASGAKDVTDEEGQEYNLRMRALTDYLYKRDGGIYKISETESVEDMEKVTGNQIPVNELRHSAPPSRFVDIEENGIRPKITDKVGTDNYTKSRFGVFLANGYTSGEAGPGADVFRVVNVPKSELKVDPYTRNGRNLYVERTIKPEELELLGHNPTVNIDESLLNEEGLHDGNSAKCTICHPELEAANPTTEPKELSTWDRIKLRNLKIGYRNILDDPEVIEIFKSLDVKNIGNLLKEKGLSRKADAVDRGADQIADAENLYSKIDPNLDVESTTNPAAVNATLPGSKLGAVGYLEAQGVIDLTKENFILNKELREVQKKEIEENGFTSPVTLIYDSNTGKYLLKDPEMDVARLLAARDMRPRRYAPVVVEIDGESYHPFFAKNMEMSFPEEFTPKDINYNYYPDISGVPDLPIPGRSQDEKDAISTYRGWDYSVLKSVMEDPYNTRNLSTEDREKLEKYIDTLDKLTSTDRLPEGTELYRGVSLSDMGEDGAAWREYFSNLQPGDKITTPVWFTSTTLDKIVAEEYATPGRIYDEKNSARSAVVMKITTRDGATGVPFEYDNTVFALEKEVLLPIMPKFTVTNVYEDSDGILRIDLDYGPKDRTPETTAETKKGVEPGFKNWVKRIDDIFAKADEAEEDADPSKGNILQSIFLEEAGFNGKPKVLSPEEFDAIEAETVYRGYQSTLFVDSYINSKLQYAGEGYFGNGTYTSNRRDTAENYAVSSGPDASTKAEIEERILEIKMLPDANVLSFEEVSELREWANEKTREFLNGYEKSGTNLAQMQDAEWRLFNEADYTNIAIMLGIDAIRFKVPLTDGEEYYTIILNRGKVAINGKS
jgi:hypothetical protein